MGREAVRTIGRVCGICGVIDLSRPPGREAVAGMMSELTHRGPDGTGTYFGDGVALGHLRLAIIDLSDGGVQPFPSADGSLQLLHNGEIYNYRELRAELEAKGHSFRTRTDTEVLLAAYQEWGERCVERFNGMWAFAIWDERRRSLFCSRDRFGVKPFYYRNAGGRFVFASELKAFRRAGSPLAPNERVIHDFLAHASLDHTEETFFDGILRLLPAHSLSFGAEGLRLWRHWQLEPREVPAGDPAAAVRELFVDSVRLRLRSDVPVGTALSGGLDSSAVVCVVDHLLRTEAENAKPVGERQKTFTAYFEDTGFDERPYARAVVERTLVAPHWISFSSDELLATLPELVEQQDEPFGSTSIAAQWHVMREARANGITVMLDGQGGDETLAGYRAYFAHFFSDLLRSGRLLELGRELLAYRRVQGASALDVVEALTKPFAPPGVRLGVRARVSGSAALVHPALREVGGPVAENGHPDDSRLRRQLRLMMTRRGLPELLRYEDRNSMAHSLEARVPFLDYRLVELLFSLDARHLIERGRTKAILRRALGDLLPPLVRERTDKVGFVTPERRWLRESLGELADDLFRSPRTAERGWIDTRAAQERLERHRRGELDAGRELWRALNLELWARAFLGGTA
jgi:asparagine synthase (glutamine-hydrolysing)